MKKQFTVIKLVLLALVTTVFFNTGKLNAQCGFLAGEELDAICTNPANSSYTMDSCGNNVTLTAASVVALFDLTIGIPNTCGTITATLEGFNGSFPAVFTANAGSVNTVLYRVEDSASGNFRQCSSTVTVTTADMTVPVCVGLSNATVTLGPDGTATLPAMSFDGGSSDNCATVGGGLLFNIGAVGGPYTPSFTFDCTAAPLTTPFPMELEVSDGITAPQTCPVVVTEFVDNNPPDVMCIPDQDLILGNDYTGGPNGSGDTEINLTPDFVGSFTTVCMGVTVDESIDIDFFDCSDNLTTVTVTYTADDGTNPPSTCSTDFTILDDTPPVAIPHSAPEAELDASGNVTVTALDIEGGAMTVPMPSDDNCGIACYDILKGPSTAVEIFDATGASIGFPFGPGSGVYPNSFLSGFPGGLFFDDLGTMPITDFPCSSPSVDFDCFELGMQPVTLVITDDAQNLAWVNVMVDIQDNILPDAVCNTIALLDLDETGNGLLDPDVINNGSSDNCSVVGLVVSPDMFDCDDLGSHMVTLSVTDPAGNIATCPSTVIVRDIAPPEFEDPDDEFYNSDPPSTSWDDNFQADENAPPPPNEVFTFPDMFSGGDPAPNIEIERDLSICFPDGDDDDIDGDIAGGFFGIHEYFLDHPVGTDDDYEKGVCAADAPGLIQTNFPWNDVMEKWIALSFVDNCDTPFVVTYTGDVLTGNDCLWRYCYIFDVTDINGNTLSDQELCFSGRNELGITTTVPMISAWNEYIGSPVFDYVYHPTVVPAGYPLRWADEYDNDPFGPEEIIGENPYYEEGDDLDIWPRGSQGNFLEIGHVEGCKEDALTLAAADYDAWSLLFEACGQPVEILPVIPNNPDNWCADAVAPPEPLPGETNYRFPPVVTGNECDWQVTHFVVIATADGCARAYNDHGSPKDWDQTCDYDIPTVFRQIELVITGSDGTAPEVQASSMDVVLSCDNDIFTDANGTGENANHNAGLGIYLAANTSPVATGIPVYTEDCNHAVNVTFTDVWNENTNTDCGGDGTLVRTWRGTNPCGDFTEYVQNITIESNPALITGTPSPVNINQEADSPQCTEFVSFLVPTYDGICGGINDFLVFVNGGSSSNLEVQGSPGATIQPGDIVQDDFGVGEHIITYAVQDCAGNWFSGGQFEINISEGAFNCLPVTQEPCPSDETFDSASPWGPDPTGLFPTVVDNSITISGIEVNGPNEGYANGEIIVDLGSTLDPGADSHILLTGPGCIP